MKSFEFPKLSRAQKVMLLAAGVGLAATACASSATVSAKGMPRATATASESASSLPPCAPTAPSPETAGLFGKKLPLSLLTTEAGRLATCARSTTSSNGEKVVSGQFSFDEGNTITLSVTTVGNVTATQGLAELTATETDKDGTIVRAIDASANKGTFLVNVEEVSGHSNIYAVVDGEPSNFCQSTADRNYCDLATGKAADADGKALLTEVEGTFADWLGEGTESSLDRVKNPIPVEPQFNNLMPNPDVMPNSF